MPTEPEQPEPRERPDQPEGPGPADVPDHDDTGLDLARSIARGLAGARRTVRRRTPPRPGARMRRTDPEGSGAHPDDRDPQLLDSTIGRLIADRFGEGE